MSKDPLSPQEVTPWFGESLGSNWNKLQIICPLPKGTSLSFAAMLFASRVSECAVEKEVLLENTVQKSQSPKKHFYDNWNVSQEWKNKEIKK